MKLNYDEEEIDRLRGHARDGGAVVGEALLKLLQDWVTLRWALQYGKALEVEDAEKSEKEEAR